MRLYKIGNESVESKVVKIFFLIDNQFISIRIDKVKKKKKKKIRAKLYIRRNVLQK